MANQNVLQLPQQSSTDATSVFYAVTGGTTDTGIPLSVLFTSPTFTGSPTIPGYAKLSANTFTATQTLAAAGPSVVLNDTSGTGLSSINFMKNGATQWFMNCDNTAAQWCLNRNNGAGTFQDKPIVIAQSSGLVTILSASFTNACTINGTLSGTGVTNYFSSPSAIGNTTPSTGAFTTLSATGNFTPSQTNGIVGTTTNNNANAGSVGEYVTNTATGVAMTSPNAANVTSISLTAGDWDVSGSVQFNAAATTVQTTAVASISTTSATAGPLGNNARIQATFATSGTQSLNTPVVRLSLASTTTVFLVAAATFSTSTLSCDGLIRARRVR